MSNKEQFLTHGEIMDGLTMCFRELIGAEISNRNMPNYINRGRAAAAIVTASHREELMEAKRHGTILALKSAETPTLNKLTPKNQSKK